MLESLRNLRFGKTFRRAERAAAPTLQDPAPQGGSPAPTPPVQAPAPGGPAGGELRLRLPKVFVLRDVPMPLTYH